MFELQSWRIRTPVVLQMEPADCAAAALGVVLSYFKKHVALDSLREDCGISRDGGSAKGILSAGRKHGLKSRCFRTEPSNLKKRTSPLIIHWQFNHFVVLEGYRKGTFFVNDPAFGPRRVSEREFDSSFTGIAFEFEPLPGFEHSGDRRTLRRALTRQFQGLGLGLPMLFYLSLLLTFPGILAAVFGRLFVDYWLTDRTTGWLVPIFVGIASAALLKGLLVATMQNILLRLEMRLTLENTALLLARILQLPFEFFLRRFGGDIGHRVELGERVAVAITGQIASVFLSLPPVAFYGILMFIFEPRLATLVILITSVNVAAGLYFAKKRRLLGYRLQQEHAALASSTTSCLQMIETLKACGAEHDTFEKWVSHHTRTIRSEQKLAMWTIAANSVSTLTAALSLSCVIGVGAWSVTTGEMSLGTVVAFQTLVFSFSTPLSELVRLSGDLQQLDGDLTRIDDVFTQETSGDLALEQVASGDDTILGDLALDHVTFGYRKFEDPIVEDFTMRIEKGQFVSIVGASGSGKSTIAKLVAGLHDPWEGQVTFDGADRRTYSRSALGSSVAFVSQETQFFDGSIRNNLTLWSPLVSEHSILDSSRDAQILDAISDRRHNFDAHLDNNCSSFSGGERQRLEIARALALNPKILILDEATSALDARTEEQVILNIRKRKLTCIQVAHRMSAVRDSNLIVVMREGRIVESGEHEELMKLGGHYFDLVSAEKSESV